MKRKKSIYSVTFDNKNPYWTKSRAMNVLFLRNIQRYVNELLRLRENSGMINHIVLNDVFEKLGFPKTAMGYLVGWIYREKNPIGDNYIDFDINSRGFNPNVVLDFNVDGNIIDMLMYGIPD